MCGNDCNNMWWIIILILLFRIQKTDVQGNENITDEQIMTWIGEDKKAKEETKTDKKK